LSLYNQIMGLHSTCAATLAMLDVDQQLLQKIRFRDAQFHREIEDDGSTEDWLLIYTRTGGANRKAYKNQIYDLTNHSLFVTDDDDERDSTFMNFWFSIPEDHEDDVKKFLDKDTGNHCATPTVRYWKVIDDMQAGKSTPQVQKAIEVGRKVFAKVEQAAVAKPTCQPVIIEV